MNFDIPAGGSQYTRLWIAVLEGAVKDANKLIYPSEARAARKWLRSTETKSGSFAWICETVLGVSPRVALRSIESKLKEFTREHHIQVESESKAREERTTRDADRAAKRNGKAPRPRKKRTDAYRSGDAIRSRIYRQKRKQNRLAKK